MKRKEVLLCKNCKLFDSKNRICTVTILHENEKWELPVMPNDECHWEKMGVDVHEIRAWSDGKNGYVKTTDPNLEVARKDDFHNTAEARHHKQGG